MSAERVRIIGAAAGAFALLALPLPAQAADKDKLVVNLTEAPEPDGKAWEDPARLSFTIDPNGPDKLSAQVNLELEKRLSLPTERKKAIKGFVVWNRETGGEDKQDNFEAGMAFSVGYKVDLDRRPGESADDRARKIDVAYRLSTAYARTAEYADLSSGACATTPSLPQCATQFKESLRTSAAINFFNAHLERDRGKVFRFSLEPQVGIDHDLLLNSPINTATGARAKGSYLSAMGGLKLWLWPASESPNWAITASGNLRQRLLVSSSREASIKDSAFLFEASATYYVVKPTDDSLWRAGVGVTYTRGSDPLNGVSDVNRIVLALRIGRY